MIMSANTSSDESEEVMQLHNILCSLTPVTYQLSLSLS